MKIAVASHSLVAERQRWFFDYMGMLNGVEGMQLSPKVWGPHRNERGYDITMPGRNPGTSEFYFYASALDVPSMTDFTFSEKAILDLESFKPDIVLVQNEAYCRVTSQLKRVAKRAGAKFVIFVWENINPPSAEAGRNLSNADLVVCGNGEAQHLVKPFNKKTLRCIQVGVNTTLFSPRNVPKEYDLIFQARPVAEKGIEVIREALKESNLTVLWPEPSFGTPYNSLSERYSRAKIHLSPSIDTPNWREQHAGYANLEALASGLYVATSDSAAIVASLFECPGVLFSRQNDPQDLRREIFVLLKMAEHDPVNAAGRAWVEENYGYRAVSQRLLEAFRKL